MQGCDVILSSSSFHVPPRCASCGASPSTTLEAKKRKGLWGGGRVTRSFEIPYCQSCAARARAATTRGYLFTAVTLLIALGASCIGFAVPTLPIAVLVGVPTALAFGFAVIAATVLGPKAPPPPAMAKGDAVRLISFSGERSVLHCVSPAWGEEFAQVNRAQVVPKSRSLSSAFVSVATGLVGAPVVALVVWGLTHPQVRIDNAGESALQIWVDGRPAMVVGSSPAGNEPPAIWVPFGKRVLGYSKIGASQPEATTEANIGMLRAHLYNPAKTACYWLVADSYGAASIAGISQGPQPIKDFYSFNKVNTWFGDNPQMVKVKDGQAGDTRVALQRAPARSRM